MKKCFLFLLIAAPVFCFAQDEKLVRAKELVRSGKTVSDLLTDVQFDTVRPETSFRELIKENAKQHSISITPPNEAGTKITVKGTISNAQQQPLKNTLVYVYQTDTRGWYGSDRVHFQMNEGDRKHARLFGYLRTDANGKFEIHTIQPRGYPGSELPAHIHFEVFNDHEALLISELLFDDDERLQGEIRSRSEREKFYISKPVTEKGNKIYNYSIRIER